jgi:4-hydroxy-3-polyprenylbenzoate decarboxylase
MPATGKWVVGITGASGAVYAVRLIQSLLVAGMEVHLVISDSGWRVLKEELDWDTSKREEALKTHFPHGRWIHYPIKDIGAAIASGSFLTDGMVIVPCSMGTLSGLANGASDNLIKRAADVIMKEGRPLFLVPRETPLHVIHLENMTKLARMGVRIIPAMPGFYHRPRHLDEMVDFLVGKILDSMGIEHQLYHRWGSE